MGHGGSTPARTPNPRNKRAAVKPATARSLPSQPLTCGMSLVSPTPPIHSMHCEETLSATCEALSLAMAASLTKGSPAILRRAAL